ncbi:MAG: hypothetical protein M5U26_05265 [Planctomycetota bacterium]|nr:hypothetical protein [Planctomycetota bacterium]
MTYIADMAACDYFGLNHGGHLIAIGWLDKAHDYPKGTLKEDDILHLNHLLLNPFQPMLFLGTHQCNLCASDGPEGYLNLFVPDQGDILVAPELIMHYIEFHNYLPPHRFMTALRNLPGSNGIEYESKLIANNGSFLSLPDNTFGEH